LIILFSSDQKVLYENEIQLEAGDNTKLEANLFVRVANKAQGVRADLWRVNERIRRTVETKVIVLSEELTEDVQEETTVKDMPDTIITEAQFFESFLDLSDREKAGSEDVTNPLAGIESRAGAFKDNS